MAEAGDGTGHTPLTPEWTPAPRASHYPWRRDRPGARPSTIFNFTASANTCIIRFVVLINFNLPDLG